MNSVIPNWLKKRAEITPKRLAIKTENIEKSFYELYCDSVSFAKKLAGIGVKKDDHISLLVSNKYESIAVIHALEMIGAVIVMINSRLTPLEIQWQIEDSHSNKLLFDDENASKAYEVKNLLNKATLIESIHRLEKEAEVIIRDEFNLEDTHTILYTSGTTGKPKGVILTYGNHWWSATGSVLNLGLQENDCWLCCLPIFHVGGLSILIRSVIYGISVNLHANFNESKINHSILTEGVTIISVVSTMLHRMVKKLGANYPSSFRCVLLGGGPAPKPLLENCLQRKIPVYQTYGMTETASQIVTLTAEYMLSKVGSAGKALFPFQVKIMENGKEQKECSIGEIVVKGNNVSNGYYNREDATASVHKDGWFYTGDMGYLDEEGFLYVVDRRNDLIISGGENIYPAEIESVLMAHPQIDEAGVIGIEDIEWGKVPVAFVTITTDDFEEDEIISYCKVHLASYKVPKKIYVIEDFPRNASNKLVRQALKQYIP